LGELAVCRRTGSVSEYSEQFLSLLARVGPLSDTQQVQLFTVGLQPPLSIDVQIQAPHTLEVAMNLARSYELREQSVNIQQQPTHSSTGSALLPSPTTTQLAPLPLAAPPLPLPLPAPPKEPVAPASSVAAITTTTTPVASRAIRRLTPDEMEERHRLSLCFNCDEKYVRGHNMTCKRLFLLELSEAPP